MLRSRSLNGRRSRRCAALDQTASTSLSLAATDRKKDKRKGQTESPGREGGAKIFEQQGLDDARRKETPQDRYRRRASGARRLLLLLPRTFWGLAAPRARLYAYIVRALVTHTQRQGGQSHQRPIPRLRPLRIFSGPAKPAWDRRGMTEKKADSGSNASSCSRGGPDRCTNETAYPPHLCGSQRVARSFSPAPLRGSLAKEVPGQG